MTTKEQDENLKSFSGKMHQHKWTVKGNYEVCEVCNKKKLALKEVPDQERSLGIKRDGKTYSVRDHRMAWFYPEVWEKVYLKLGSSRARLTADILIRTGARINEVRHIMLNDCDFERNTVRLRVTKTKAKKGEKKGKPRTIPMDSKFLKSLKKHFGEDGSLPLLSTPAFNLALHKACKDSGMEDHYNYSAHSIRKTHGNWLKVLGNLGLMKVDASEICLRLGHDYNTFLKDYGSSGVMSNKDVQIARKILGELYAR